MLSKRLSGILFLLLACQMAAMQNYTISTIAGGGLPNTVAVAASTALINPANVSVDTGGNVYFVCLNAIFKVGSGGALMRIAGSSEESGFAGDGSWATNAWLDAPQAVVSDRSGNLYIADSGNNRIRKVWTDGTITTIAGNGVAGYGGDGAAAANSQISNPMGLALDSTGNLYIADNGNNAIRKIATNGLISTVTQIDAPLGLAIDGGGNLYTASEGAVYQIPLGNAPVLFAGGGNGCGQQTNFLGDGCPAIDGDLGYPSGNGSRLQRECLYRRFLRQFHPKGQWRGHHNSGGWRNGLRPSGRLDWRWLQCD